MYIRLYIVFVIVSDNKCVKCIIHTVSDTIEAFHSKLLALESAQELFKVQWTCGAAQGLGFQIYVLHTPSGMPGARMPRMPHEYRHAWATELCGLAR